MALLRGALRSMRQSQIDLLVVGLPVALFAVKKAALERVMTGEHDVGGGKKVSVVRTLAVAQPQGALAFYAHAHGKLGEIAKERSLIIDPGARTFDWLVAQGMRLVQKQSHSVNRGVADVLKLLAAEITKDIGTPFRDLDAIDMALRTGKAPVIFQKPYDLKRLLPLAERDGAGRVEHEGVDRIAAQPAKHHPRGRRRLSVPEGREVGVSAPPDPRDQGACVRQREGFQLAGMTYARTVLAADRDRSTTAERAAGDAI